MTDDSVALYRRLVETNSCTPEEQAGPDAGVCPACQRKTLHQICHECMNPKCPDRLIAFAAERLRISTETEVSWCLRHRYHVSEAEAAEIIRQTKEKTDDAS